MKNLIYAALMVLSLGVLTSMTLLALSHIFILIPALYFIPKSNFKKMNKSFWALLALVIILILSVALNQDIAVHGWQPISKIKYFLFGLGAVAPFTWWTYKFSTEKKISYLLYIFCVATSVATLSGLWSIRFGFNPLLFKAVPAGGRYGGVFGMVMNYAHNMSYFLIILLGMFIYRDRLKNFINSKFLLVILIINLVGFYFCYTRGAWLGFLVGVPFYFLRLNKKMFIVAFLTIGFVGAITYFVAGDKVIRSYSDTQRISQWRAAIKAFQERPILGYGYLNFEPHSGEIKERYNLGELKLVSHAHNNFFEILADTGILGFIAYGLWLVFWIREMFIRDDVIGFISIPFIVVFIVGGLTQATISLGINLFFIMGAYSVSQISPTLFKEVLTNE